MQAEKEVRVIYPQRLAGPNGQGCVKAGSAREKRSDVVGRVIIDPAAKAIVQSERDGPVLAGLELDFRGVTNVLLIASQNAEIPRPQQLHLFRIKNIDECLAHKLGF